MATGRSGKSHAAVSSAARTADLAGPSGVEPGLEANIAAPYHRLTIRLRRFSSHWRVAGRDQAAKILDKLAVPATQRSLVIEGRPRGMRRESEGQTFRAAVQQAKEDTTFVFADGQGARDAVGLANLVARWPNTNLGASTTFPGSSGRPWILERSFAF